MDVEAGKRPAVDWNKALSFLAMNFACIKIKENPPTVVVDGSGRGYPFFNQFLVDTN